MEKAPSPVTASCRSLLSRPSPPHLRARPQGRRTARGPVLRARAGTAGAKLGVGKGGEVPRPGVRGAGRGGLAGEARGRGGKGSRGSEGRGAGVAARSDIRSSARPRARSPARPAAARPASSGGGHGALAGPGFRAREAAARRPAAAP